MKYAVNLAMYMSLNELHPVRFLLAPLMTTSTVDAEPDHVAGTALVLDCTDLERVEAIVKVIRMRLKRRDLKMYQSKNGKTGWKSV